MKTLLSLVQRPLYALLMMVTFLVVFLLTSVLPHVSEIQAITAFGSANSDGASVFLSALKAFVFHTVEPTLIPTTILSILISITIVLLVRYYQIKGDILLRTSGAGSVGLVLGVLGIGCTACGTLALTAVLGTIGLGWIVALLPFGGVEILYVGMILMLLSIWQLIRLIEKPLICE